MREFKQSFDNQIVDLDDPKTYEHLPQNIEELRTLMLSLIGYSHCYMKHWYRDIFDDTDGGQKERVERLVKNFTDNERSNFNNIMWYQEQIFIFQDEIENMC